MNLRAAFATLFRKAGATLLLGSAMWGDVKIIRNIYSKFEPKTGAEEHHEN